MTAAYHMATGGGDPETLLAACNGSRRMAALLLMTARLHQTVDDIERLGWADDVAEVCNMFELATLAGAATENDASEAVIGTLIKSHASLHAKKIANANKPHASPEWSARLEEAYQARKREEYPSDAACARAFANYYRGAGEPKQRSYQAHLTRRRREEAVSLERAEEEENAALKKQ
jgi:hypothetical protein